MRNHRLTGLRWNTDTFKYSYWQKLCHSVTIIAKNDKRCTWCTTLSIFTESVWIEIAKWEYDQLLIIVLWFKGKSFSLEFLKSSLPTLDLLTLFLGNWFWSSFNSFNRTNRWITVFFKGYAYKEPFSKWKNTLPQNRVAPIRIPSMQSPFKGILWNTTHL